MLNLVKPRIGILALMQGLYDESQPEIPANQTKFVEDVIGQLKDAAEFVFPGLSADRAYCKRL